MVEKSESESQLSKCSSFTIAEQACLALQVVGAKFQFGTRGLPSTPFSLTANDRALNPDMQADWTLVFGPINAANNAHGVCSTQSYPPGFCTHTSLLFHTQYMGL